MSKVRNFAFTCNNYTVEQEELVRGEKYKYLVYGYEVSPTTNTPHLQGTICYKSVRSLSAIRSKLVGFHVEPCRDVDASIKYCKKVEGFYEDGDWTAKADKTKTLLLKRKEQTQLVMNNNIVDLALQGDIAIGQIPLLHKAKMIMLMNVKPYVHDDFNRKRGQWYCGPSRTGKSRTARSNYPDAYIKSQNKWWCGYHGQKAVILDDMDCNALGHLLKIWADSYACMGETKNGQVQLVYDTIVVTSNYTIEELFVAVPIMVQPLLERFHVTHFRHGL